jgi:ribonuclease Z
MSFSVTILGSSSALPTSKRSLTAQLVNHDERFFLIDCGEGTQMQLRKFKKKIARINHIFISHLHGDHIFGLFGLLSTFSMLGRKSQLHIYSDLKLKEFLTVHFNFFQKEMTYPVFFHPFSTKKSKIIYDDGKLEVSTIPLLHRVPCAGFLFREKDRPLNVKKELIGFYNLGIKDIIKLKNGEDIFLENGRKIANEVLTIAPSPAKSFAYCSDTKARGSIIKYITNINLLYHEATFLEEDKELAKKTFHSTASQAANIALKANVKKLVIGHFSSRYKNEINFLNEAISIFPNTIMAEDGMEFEI